MKNWTIAKQVGAGFALLVIVLVAVSAGGILTMRSASAEIDPVDSSFIPVSELAMSFERSILNARIHLIYHVTIHKPGARESGLALLQKAKETVNQLESAIGKTAEFGTLEPLAARLRAEMADYDTKLERVLTAVSTGSPPPDQRTSLIGEWAASGGRVVGTAAEMKAAADRTTTAAVRTSVERLGRGAFLLFLGALASILLAAAAGWWTTRGVTGALRDVVGELSHGAGQVASASRQTASASQSLAQGASQQAASLEEVSSTSEEIRSMARRNAERSLAAAALVSQSRTRFEEATGRVRQTIEAMAAINTQSGKIAGVIRVIDEIAFQTNILALNAAVEAARAGEAGMGFAVVADEVRNLAQRCAQAARDTTALIEESITRAQGGKASVDQTAASLMAATEDSDKLKNLIDEVNAGSQEQDRGIQQIAAAIGQMERVIQSFAAGAQESASAGEELNAQSSALQGIVQRLAGGRSGAPAAGLA